MYTLTGKERDTVAYEFLQDKACMLYLTREYNAYIYIVYISNASLTKKFAVPN